MTDLAEMTKDSVFENMKGTRDALSVKRVFGDAYQVDGVTIIPVARVKGGAGGGAGEGSDGEDEGEGRGFGSGFGMGVQPVGVYEVRNGEAVWKPTVDVSRIAERGQVLAGIIAVCVTILLWRRW
ncbi:MAG: spore germination protein GerW family protein [Acidimicrobiia bacterium]|nr:spore germination protein GerW family protein [Acidimicrobiia bacterium]